MILIVEECSSNLANRGAITITRYYYYDSSMNTRINGIIEIQFRAPAASFLRAICSGILAALTHIKSPSLSVIVLSM